VITLRRRTPIILQHEATECGAGCGGENSNPEAEYVPKGDGGGTEDFPKADQLRGDAQDASDQSRVICPASRWHPGELREANDVTDDEEMQGRVRRPIGEVEAYDGGGNEDRRPGPGEGDRGTPRITHAPEV